MEELELELDGFALVEACPLMSELELLLGLGVVAALPDELWLALLSGVAVEGVALGEALEVAELCEEELLGDAVAADCPLMSELLAAGVLLVLGSVLGVLAGLFCVLFCVVAADGDED